MNFIKKIFEDIWNTIKHYYLRPSDLSFWGILFSFMSLYLCFSIVTDIILLGAKQIIPNIDIMIKKFNLGIIIEYIKLLTHTAQDLLIKISQKLLKDSNTKVVEEGFEIKKEVLVDIQCKSLTELEINMFTKVKKHIDFISNVFINLEQGDRGIFYDYIRGMLEKVIKEDLTKAEREIWLKEILASLEKTNLSAIDKDAIYELHKKCLKAVFEAETKADESNYKKKIVLWLLSIGVVSFSISFSLLLKILFEQ